VFAVYHPQHGSALAQGGRYDGVGAYFGRQRPATGFDVNLKNLLVANSATQTDDTVFAPYVQAGQQHDLQQAVRNLRMAGQRVRCALTETESTPANCRRKLTLVEQQWQVVDCDD
jgi:ATP phosphoribosyltransferase regulatory subunit